jgi:hypothetical protein
VLAGFDRPGHVVWGDSLCSTCEMLCLVGRAISSLSSEFDETIEHGQYFFIIPYPPITGFLLCFHGRHQDVADQGDDVHDECSHMVSVMSGGVLVHLIDGRLCISTGLNSAKAEPGMNCAGHRHNQRNVDIQIFTRCRTSPKIPQLHRHN